MDAMKLIVDKLVPKSSLKNARSPITELNQSFVKKVEAMNEKLAMNKHSVVQTFADNQVMEKRQNHREMMKRVGEDLCSDDDELEQMIIKEEKEQTINDLMAQDVRIDFQALADAEPSIRESCANESQMKSESKDVDGSE